MTEEGNKQNSARARQSWCFKMCTGTPHCGSGVQAADELLIPTSSVLAFPFHPPPPPSRSPLAAQLSADLSDREKRCVEEETKAPACSVILEGVWRLTQADEGSISCEPKQTVPSAGGGGSLSCAGQTRSIIQETEATEEKKAVQTRIRLERLIVFFPVILSSTTENLRGDSFNVCGCECECLVLTVSHST